jgi:hypothetical protein
MRPALAGIVALGLLLGATVAVSGAPSAQGGDVPSATPAQLAALREILDRPEFQAGEGRSAIDRALDPVRTWIRSLGQQALRWLARVLGPIFEAGGAAILWGIVGVGLVILVGVAVLLRRLMRGAVADEAILDGFETAGLPRAADELARAREAAGAGDARRALHHHYRAVLLRLDERDHLSLDSALTNRELLPRLAASPALAEPFAALVARFDRLWYGQTACSMEEYAAFVEIAERVWQAADSTPPARPGRRIAPEPALAAGAPGGPG